MLLEYGIHPREYLENPATICRGIRVWAQRGEEYCVKALEKLQKAEEECELELNLPHSSPERALWLVTRGDVLRNRGEIAAANDDCYLQAQQLINGKLFGEEFSRAFNSAAEAVYGSAFAWAFFRNDKAEALDQLAAFWAQLEDKRDAVYGSLRYATPIKMHLLHGVCCPLNSDASRQIAYRHLSVVEKFYPDSNELRLPEFSFLDQILVARAVSVYAYLQCGGFKDIPGSALRAKDMIRKWGEGLPMPEAKQVLLCEFPEYEKPFSPQFYDILDRNAAAHANYAKFLCDMGTDFFNAGYPSNARSGYEKAFAILSGIRAGAEESGKTGKGMDELRALHQQVMYLYQGADVVDWKGKVSDKVRLDESTLQHRVVNAIHFFSRYLYAPVAGDAYAQTAYAALSELEDGPQRAAIRRMDAFDQTVLAYGYVWLSELIGNKKWNYGGNSEKARAILAAAKDVVSAPKALAVLDAKLGTFKKKLFGGYTCEWMKTK